MRPVISNSIWAVLSPGTAGASISMEAVEVSNPAKESKFTDFLSYWILFRLFVLKVFQISLFHKKYREIAALNSKVLLILFTPANFTIFIFWILHKIEFIWQFYLIISAISYVVPCTARKAPHDPAYLKPRIPVTPKSSTVKKSNAKWWAVLLIPKWLWTTAWCKTAPNVAILWYAWIKLVSTWHQWNPIPDAPWMPITLSARDEGYERLWDFEPMDIWPLDKFMAYLVYFGHFWNTLEFVYFWSILSVLVDIGLSKTNLSIFKKSTILQSKFWAIMGYFGPI